MHTPHNLDMNEKSKAVIEKSNFLMLLPLLKNYRVIQLLMKKSNLVKIQNFTHNTILKSLSFKGLFRMQSWPYDFLLKWNKHFIKFMSLDNHQQNKHTHTQWLQNDCIVETFWMIFAYIYCIKVFWVTRKGMNSWVNRIEI